MVILYSANLGPWHDRKYSSSEGGEEGVGEIGRGRKVRLIGWHDFLPSNTLEQGGERPARGLIKPAKSFGLVLPKH